MTAREALKELRDNLEIHLKASPMYSTDHCTINSAEVAAMIADADEALAKPERNCEVGTAEEQWKRFDEFCISWEESGPNGGCSDRCPCMAIKSKESNGCFGQSGCFFIWAQMPYESERKGDGDGSI